MENLSYSKREGGAFMTDLTEIGRNIVLLRRAQGLTQEEVAYRSHLSVSCLQAVEYGCQNTTVDTLIGIAEAPGIDSRVFGIFRGQMKLFYPKFASRPSSQSRKGEPCKSVGTSSCCERQGDGRRSSWPNSPTPALFAYGILNMNAQTQTLTSCCA